MCGRFVNTHTTEELAKYFDASDLTKNQIKPSFNIGPTQMHAVVLRNEEYPRVLMSAKWGLVPPWAKEVAIGVKMFNARAETVAEKPSFRSALAKRRCIVPASGYYEWKKDGDKKQPWYIHEPKNGILGFAGLWEQWRENSIDGAVLTSFTILTSNAPEHLAAIHDRAPVVLHFDLYEEWLDDATPKEDVLAEALHRNGVGSLEKYAVGRDVGNIRNNTPSLIEPS